MVGTPPIMPMRSSSISRLTAKGSNWRTSTIGMRFCIVPSVMRPQPEVWNIGMGLSATSPGTTPARAIEKRALLVRPRWVSTAPFGKPVVPEVYWICTGSPGATSGSVPARRPP